MASPAPHPRRTVIVAALVGALAGGIGTTYAVFSATAGTPSASTTPASASALAPAAASAATATASSAASTAPTASPAHASRSKEQAAAALMALPELQAWSALLEKQSGGKAHGALIEYDAALRTVRGKTYWQFSFVENSEEAALRWESFLLSTSDDEILVEDLASDELLSLERWRKEKQPGKRTSIDG
ncbi:hypothetical protein [Rugamonas brunnea]|uniref:hypothetical protein n=1 Tax=Rugamonas brunnea TaxID=2758569 RepID=UPI001E489A8E|nr:hypothetical protein [Rugamonas brunnea]